MTQSDLRRWWGVGALGVAVVMLMGGETLLKGHLSPLGFVLYWAICFFATGIAIILAFAEVRAVQRNARQQHRALFDSTLKQIEAEARTRGEPEPNHHPPAPPASPGA